MKRIALIAVLLVAAVALPVVAGDAQQDEKKAVPMPEHVAKILKMMPVKPDPDKGWTEKRCVAARDWMKNNVSGYRINISGRFIERSSFNRSSDRIKLISDGDNKRIESVEIICSIPPGDEVGSKVGEILYASAVIGGVEFSPQDGGGCVVKFFMRELRGPEK